MYHDLFPIHQGERRSCFSADTLTNAGVDDVGSYRKVHIFERAGERSLTLLSAGNLATTQAALCHPQQKVNNTEYDSLFLAVKSAAENQPCISSTATG